MPRSLDPTVRSAILESASRLLATEGPSGLTLRRLATEAGVSTMPIYTYFGGMDQVRSAACEEGFDRLAAQLEAVGVTKRPLRDIVGLIDAYCDFAVANPHIYRTVFMNAMPFDAALGGVRTFEMLVAAVQRAGEDGSLSKGDGFERARQLWALMHGAVALHLTDLLDDATTKQTAREGSAALLRGYGADPAKLKRAMKPSS